MEEANVLHGRMAVREHEGDADFRYLLRGGDQVQDRTLAPLIVGLLCVNGVEHWGTGAEVKRHVIVKLTFRAHGYHDLSAAVLDVLIGHVLPHGRSFGVGEEASSLKDALEVIQVGDVVDERGHRVG